jgi:hypothetical protein
MAQRKPAQEDDFGFIDDATIVDVPTTPVPKKHEPSATWKIQTPLTQSTAQRRLEFSNPTSLL